MTDDRKGGEINGELRKGASGQMGEEVDRLEMTDDREGLREVDRW